MNNKQILEKTLEVLKKDGWCKNTQLSSSGQRCIWGGLNEATGYDTHTDVVEVLDSCVCETELAKAGPREDTANSKSDWTTQKPTFRLAGYNNDPEVSFEDIVNLIECAIKKVE